MSAEEASLMDTEDVLAEFEAAGALQKGHFKLSSGLHSGHVSQQVHCLDVSGPDGKLCQALAAKARAAVGEIDFVVSPAMGAIIYGYETSRHLGVPFMFVERVDGEFQLAPRF